MRRRPPTDGASLVARPLRRLAGAFPAVLDLAPGTGALTAAVATPPAEPPEARAVRANVAPVVDGDVRGDPAWADVPALTAFWQTAPEAGAPLAADRGADRLHRLLD